VFVVFFQIKDLAGRFSVNIPHQFSENTFLTPSFCGQCGQFIVGIYKQGVKCESINIDLFNLFIFLLKVIHLKKSY